MSAIQVYRGDSKELAVTLQNADSSPYDLTGMRVVFSVKVDLDAKDYLIQEVAEVKEDGSVALVHLSPQSTEIDPGVYPYDIELSNESRSFVSTIVRGNFTVVADVGRWSA